METINLRTAQTKLFQKISQLKEKEKIINFYRKNKHILSLIDAQAYYNPKGKTFYVQGIETKDITKALLEKILEEKRRKIIIELEFSHIEAYRRIKNLKNNILMLEFERNPYQIGTLILDNYVYKQLLENEHIRKKVLHDSNILKEKLDIKADNFEPFIKLYINRIRELKKDDPNWKERKISLYWAKSGLKKISFVSAIVKTRVEKNRIQLKIIDKLNQPERLSLLTLLFETQEEIIEKIKTSLKNITEDPEKKEIIAQIKFLQLSEKVLTSKKIDTIKNSIENFIPEMCWKDQEIIIIKDKELTIERNNYLGYFYQNKLPEPLRNINHLKEEIEYTKIIIEDHFIKNGLEPSAKNTKKLPSQSKKTVLECIKKLKQLKKTYRNIKEINNFITTQKLGKQKSLF
ncbi:hypothetical protein [Persephonella sp. KM09-Lau-8]|uniref:hypothetical protein n=1 Tax=Persephonella sp. KM09-Lau-8 TaxID=1158345 RepID=UPI000496203E|nr:hypothetical protein [Persephonella sp. KM09-Lau-8]